MRRALFLIGTTIPWILLLAGPSGGEESARIVKIGLVDSLTEGIPPAFTQVAMRPFKALMETQIGMTGEVVNAGDAIALAGKLHDDKVQVGVFHGHEYAWAKQKYPSLKAIALCVNKTMQTKVHLLVRADSPAESYADLKNKAISVPLLGRAICRLYLERRCVKPGIGPDKFYERVEKPLATADALEDLVEGDVAAAIVDAASWNDYTRNFPARARRLRILADSEPFPCGVIACYPGKFSDAQMRKFSAGLLAAPTTTRGKDTLRTLRITAFELPPANHDVMLQAIVKAYPPPAPAVGK
jgi:ABC-type phosphate/phosphonate transport system substrate-binding protein